MRSERALLEEILETTRSVAQHVSRSREDALLTHVPARPGFEAKMQFAEIIGGLEKRRKRLLIACLEGAKSARFDDDILFIEYDPESKHYRDTLVKPENLQVFREVIEEVIGKAIDIRVSITRTLL